MKHGSNGWTEYQRLVLTELERHSEALDDLHDKMGELKIELVTLRIKSTLWGTMGGTLPVLVFLLIQVIQK